MDRVWLVVLILAALTPWAVAAYGLTALLGAAS